MEEKYINNQCDKCKVKKDTRLSDILVGKSPKSGLPEQWGYFGEYVDYSKTFTLCGDCKIKWFEHLQNEIERFIS